MDKHFYRLEFSSSRKEFAAHTSKPLRYPSSENSDTPCPRPGTLSEASAIDNLFGVDKKSHSTPHEHWWCVVGRQIEAQATSAL
jgi:hypothetical protein